MYCADDARAAAVHVDFLTDVHEALVVHEDEVFVSVVKCFRVGVARPIQTAPLLETALVPGSVIAPVKYIQPFSACSCSV